jgi:hypothetical protein
VLTSFPKLIEDEKSRGFKHGGDFYEDKSIRNQEEENGSNFELV